MSAATESGDMDLSEEPSYSEEKKTSLPEQVLKEVVIPISGRSSNASSLSSARDQSSEYDTPGTSAAVTPAGSLAKEESSFKRPSRLSSKKSSYQAEEPFKGKRKRLEVDELLEADALLAQRLQEQEYGEDQDVAPKPRRAQSCLIEDSEESLLSDLGPEHSPDPDEFPKPHIPTSRRPNRGRPKALLPQAASADVEGGRSLEESLDENEISETPLPRNKRVKTDHRTFLPSRAARDSANKSIKDRTSREILDSEDSDLYDDSGDVSLLGSDSRSDAFEDSEDADEEADVVVVVDSRTTTGPANNSSPTSTAILATGRRATGGRGTGRRGAPSTQAANPIRGRRSWQRRVEDRVSSERLLIPHSGLRHALGCKGAAEARESAS